MSVENPELAEILGEEFELVAPLLKQLKRDKITAIYLASCLKGRYVYVDDSVYRIIGYAAEEILNNGLEFWMSKIHPGDKARITESIIDGHRQLLDPSYIVTELRPLTFVFRFKTGDNRWIWLQETKWIIPTNNHSKDFILGSLVDVTDKRLNEDLKLNQIIRDSARNNDLLKLALEHKESHKKQIIESSQPVESRKSKNVELLTKREKEILKYIAEGFSSKQISERLFISINTVETHRRHLLEKLEVKNSMELIKEASKAFWL